jgi:hypothetical protein
MPIDVLHNFHIFSSHKTSKSILNACSPSTGLFQRHNSADRHVGITDELETTNT